MIRKINDWIDKKLGLNKPEEPRKIYDALGFYVADKRPD